MAVLGLFLDILGGLANGIRIRNELSWLLPARLDPKSYYYDDDYWVDDDDYGAESNEYDDSAEVLLQSTHTALYSTPIPLSLHSDAPQLAVCPSSTSSSMIAIPTYSAPLTIMAESGDFCITRPHSEHPHVWMNLFIWLVLGSYVCMATLGFSFLALRRKKCIVRVEPSNTIALETKLPVKAPVPQKIGQLIYICGAPLPTSEEIFKRTLEQYGNIDESQGPKKLSPIALRAAVRKDITLLFRAPVSHDSPHDHNKILEEIEASRPNSAPSTPLDRATAPKPIHANATPTQVSLRDDPSWGSNRPALNNAPTVTYPSTIAAPKPHRPPPITVTNTSGTQTRTLTYCTQSPSPIYPCFVSSPLKHSSIPIARAASMSPVSSRMVHPPSPALSDPERRAGLKASMWAH